MRLSSYPVPYFLGRFGGWCQNAAPRFELVCRTSKDVLEHPLNTPFLFLVVGMDVEVHRRRDVGVPKDHADGLDGIFAFDATGGEAMPEAVEFEVWDVQFLNHLLVVIPVDARLDGFLVVTKDEKILVDDFHQRFDDPKKLGRKGDNAIGFPGFGLGDGNDRISFVILHFIKPLNRPLNAQCAFSRVDVRPFEATKLADS